MTHDDPEPPPFLRLDARRSGITGMLTPHPVLHSEQVSSLETELTVAKSLKLATKGKAITVSPASENAYRWYRLRRSAGSVIAAVATILGAGLLALGAIWPKTALGMWLLWAGGAVSIIAAIAVVSSAWRASIE